MMSAHKPRILHVITPSRMAGAETFLARLLRRTPAERAVHHCVSSRSGANDEMRAAGMTFDTLGIGGKANPLALPRLREAAQSFGADLLHSHLSTASWWCGWLEQVGGPPSLGHVHGFTSAMWHRRQSHLIACSHAVKLDLMEKGIPAERITVMHYPVDPYDQQPTRSAAEVRAELGAEANTPIVGTFAHLSEKKGYRELIQAAQIVLRQLPKAQFWCFGEGILRRELAQKADAARIADRFKLLGFRRDVPDLMRAIDVMCLPSHREPFGLVYVEAALSEKPVIACKAGGALEIIQDGDSGLLVPPPGWDRKSFATSNTDNRTEHQVAKDSRPLLRGATSQVEALAEAILKLLDNPIRAAAMGRCGRQLVLDRFAWPDYLRRLNELYERLLSQRPTQEQPSRQAA
jgi:glycosyltransferase involved in cell wall biosynthesis